MGHLWNAFLKKDFKSFMFFPETYNGTMLQSRCVFLSFFVNQSITTHSQTTGAIIVQSDRLILSKWIKDDQFNLLWIGVVSAATSQLEGPWFEEFACSTRSWMGFLLVPQFLPTLHRYVISRQGWIAHMLNMIVMVVCLWMCQPWDRPMVCLGAPCLLHITAGIGSSTPLALTR